MGGRFLASAILLGALSYALPLRAQTPRKASGAEKRQQATQQTAEQAPPSAGENGHLHLDGWDRPAAPEAATGRKPGPARVHDLSGIWEPVPGYRDGVFGEGPRENPADAKHMLPYTPLGLQSFTGLEPGKGTPSYLIVNGHTLPVVTPITNGPAIPSVRRDDDPFDICDPIGFPRVELFNLRAIQILQTQSQVVIIYQNDKVWRNIWTDGRELPKEILEPRWYGYSVGKWVDDTTLAVKTIGLDERTWIDNAARPHSSDLVVDETYHRVDEFSLELSVTITDPKMYTKPWVALNKFPLGLQSPSFDIREMVCAASEAQQFNSLTHTRGGATTSTDAPEK